MNRLFQNRFLPSNQNDNAPSVFYFEHLYTHAGVDMPELAPKDAPGNVILESRRAFMARLTHGQDDQPTPKKDGTAAYHEMMARIESSEPSSSFADECDDFMNPNLAVPNANCT